MIRVDPSGINSFSQTSEKRSRGETGAHKSTQEKTGKAGESRKSREQ
jgi:hypothetical protein